MMGFGQDEGGRCQGLEWNLSQTGKEVTSGWGDEEGEKVATGQRPSQHPAHWGTSCPGRGSQQAHHSDSGRAAEPERASRNRRHLHLHSQEQGGRGREWASVRICLLGSPQAPPGPPPHLPCPACSLRLTPWCGLACITGSCQPEPWISMAS